MAAPDMDVIKEIPGYKVILKAVLKSQIQQLVEQLASYTEEESVILTASVSDGTLSHLGSDSGKFFLEDHEDVKSQFLGFCLKRHHRKKQEAEQREREQKEREEAMRAAAAMRSQGRMGFMQRSPRMQSPRQPFTRVSPGFSPRGSLRQEPYPSVRPKRTSLSFDIQNSASSSGNSPVVKIEPQDDNFTNDSDQNSNSQTPSIVKPEVEDDAVSNSSTGTQQQDSSNMASGDNPEQSQGEIDIGVQGIKVEAISESEMELEITGVEPGRPVVPQENWGPSTSGGMDQAGATGSPGDMQGYNFIVGENETFNQYSSSADFQDFSSVPVETKGNFECKLCGKRFKQNWILKRHSAIHAAVKPFSCVYCQYKTTRKDALKMHIWSVHLTPSAKEQKSYL